jgi:archaemetzincin
MTHLYVGATADIEAGAHREAVAAVRDRLAAEFAVPVKEFALPAIDFAFDRARNQYASIAVLEMLARTSPHDAWKLVAVTGRDLFVPVLTFVYGQAQLGGRIALVSLARLEQEFYGLASNRDVFLDRARKEALHEAGHTLGLVHCADRTCAMTLSTNIRQIDFKHAAFCAACGARIEHALRTADKDKD